MLLIIKPQDPLLGLATQQELIMAFNANYSQAYRRILEIPGRRTAAEFETSLGYMVCSRTA